MKDTNCGRCCNQSKYSNEHRDFWLEKIRISSTKTRGFGAFAWEPIAKGLSIGEYVGQILPRGGHEVKSDYQTTIAIGKDVEDDHTAYVDSAYTGSVVRFLNHSCEPNCQLFEGRVGVKYRLAFVETLREILSGEELTIDYGES